MTISDEQLDLWGRKLLDKLKNGNLQERLYIKYLEGLSKRTEKNMDAIIAVCGERGMGKSSFAIESGVILRQFGVGFDFSDIYFGEKSLKDAVGRISTSKRRAYVFDEIIDLAYSRNAMTTMNRNIARFFTKVRKMNNIIFLCIPRIRTLDPALRNDVVHFWNEVFWKSSAKDRDKQFAMVALFRKDKNPLTDDPWGLDDRLMHKRRAYTPKDHLKLMKRVRSYVGCLAYPPLPDVLERAYVDSSENYLGEAGEQLIASLEPKVRGRPKKEPGPS